MNYIIELYLGGAFLFVFMFIFSALFGATVSDEYSRDNMVGLMIVAVCLSIGFYCLESYASYQIGECQGVTKYLNGDIKVDTLSIGANGRIIEVKIEDNVIKK